MAFDLLIRGGLLIDGTGSAARPADVGVLGDRILAVGDLSAVDVGDVALAVDAQGLVVTPGFIDPHGHSDGSLLVDGALASHLRQGFTTQVSGNCGFSLAPLTPIGRAVIENGPAQWSTMSTSCKAASSLSVSSSEKTRYSR